MIKKVLAVPVGILALLLLCVEGPICMIWYALNAAATHSGSGLPQDLTRLRMPHWYMGRLWEYLWRNK
jgi:hypothetical protein